MNTQIQFQDFNFNSNSVRVIIDPTQEPWFCGTDVCSILGYSNAPDALKKHCKETGIAKRYISYPSGRKEAIFINEPNLYRLIIKSRKPEAEPFEAWVFEEVLPQIRKTGKYGVQQQLALPEPEPTINVEFKVSELRKIVNVWLQFTRFAESVYFLIRALGLNNDSAKHDERSVVFNHNLCKQNIKDTTLIIKRLALLLPEQPKRLTKPNF